MSAARRLRHAAVKLESEEVLLLRLVDAHGEATLGGLLIVLSLPCLLPSLFGLGWVLSLGLFAVGIAMVRGSEHVHLPQRVAHLPIARQRAQTFLLALARFYVRLGRVAKPRWRHLVGPRAQRFLAVPVLFMAFVIFLPIPGGNTLPAIALLLIGCAMIFRDGLMASAGVLMSVVTLIITSGAIYAALLGLWALLS